MISPHMEQQTMMWQVIIHLTFVVSAMAMAYTDRLTMRFSPAH